MDAKSTPSTRWRYGNQINAIVSNNNHHTLDNNQNERQQQVTFKSYSKRFGHRHPSFSLARKIGLVFSVFILAYLYLCLFKISIEDLQGGSDNSEVIRSQSTPVGFVGGLEGKEQWMANSARRRLTELRPIDHEQYTIRMNTWRRPEQLIQSVKHHSSCPGVKQIQIVWCDKQNEPPREILEMTENEDSFSSTAKVVIERHEANSLNERFNILVSTPTLGILSIDDDVIRPCEAIDAGFFKWVKSPHRMVGFDARTHVENDDGSWQYGYLSTTKKENMYSLSLTRYCFVHRDYMTQYTRELPQQILDTVAKNFNCEDIAMGLMISSLTQGQPPLLADLWAMNSQLKLRVDTGISGTSTHKEFRDQCMDNFASFFGLKDENNGNRLQKATWIRKSKTWGFACGAKEDNKSDASYTKSKRETKLEQIWGKLRRSESRDYLNRYRVKLLYEAGEEARAKGLLAVK